MSNEVYVVTADTYDDGYGAEITLFGVYDTKDKAENRVENLARKNGFAFTITEVKVNKGVKEYLGGYYE